ncbi:MAG: DNA-3-methyladenine glycosylase family protein, partial [Gaiellaceae bacterium]
YRVVAGRELQIQAASAGVRVEPATLGAIAEVSRLLGLPLDLDPFRASAAADAVLGPLTNTLGGFRPTLNPRPFEALVVAITTQQISLRAAAAIRGRFVQHFGLKHEVAWDFPARELVALADPRDFVQLGFSQKKAEYVVGLARSDLDLDALAALPDDEVIAVLTALPGLGRWTADWFLARHLARPHAWPAGDLGVRKAVSAFYADGRPLTIPEVRTMGERFAPFQNLSAQYLLVGARMAG